MYVLWTAATWRVSPAFTGVENRGWLRYYGRVLVAVCVGERRSCWGSSGVHREEGEKEMRKAVTSGNKRVAGEKWELNSKEKWRRPLSGSLAKLMFLFINNLVWNLSSAPSHMKSRDTHMLCPLLVWVRVYALALCRCVAVSLPRARGHMLVRQLSSLLSHHFLFLPAGWPLLWTPTGHATTCTHINKQWFKKIKNLLVSSIHSYTLLFIHPAQLEGFGEMAVAPRSSPIWAPWLH